MMMMMMLLMMMLMLMMMIWMIRKMGRVRSRGVHRTWINVHSSYPPSFSSIYLVQDGDDDHYDVVDDNDIMKDEEQML